jgi:hypothetical protein
MTTTAKSHWLKQTNILRSGYSYHILANLVKDWLVRLYKQKITPLLTSKCRLIINWKPLTATYLYHAKIKPRNLSKLYCL